MYLPKHIDFDVKKSEMATFDLPNFYRSRSCGPLICNSCHFDSFGHNYVYTQYVLISNGPISKTSKISGFFKQ